MRLSAVFNRTNIIHMITCVSWRLNMLCIMFMIVAFFGISLFARFMRGLAFYSHVENTCIWRHHFNKRGGLGLKNKYNSATFYWSACTNPRKWVVMYSCYLPLSTILIFDFRTVWYFCFSLFYGASENIFMKPNFSII